MLNFWIILIAFAAIGLLVGKDETIPGSLTTFLGNFLVVKTSYNGAWWFLFTYILLLTLSPMIYRLVARVNSLFLLLATGGVYFVAYLVRFGIINVPTEGVINWCITQLALLGTSLLPFVIGMIFLKHKVVSKLRKKTEKLPRIVVCLLSVLLFIACIISHGFEESLIIAPIYAVVTVCVVALWKGPVMSFLKYMGEHSTNIWLIHMFFYFRLFKDFIFIFKYPILIYVMMLVVCIGSSYVVKFIYSKITACVSHFRKSSAVK